MSVADAIADYLRQRAAEGLSPASIASLTKCLRQLVRTLSSRGVLTIADVTPADLDAHLLILAERGLAHSSRLTHATVIRECFRRWHHDGRMMRNPALDLPVGDDDDVPLPEPPLEPADVAALIAAIPKRDALDLRNRAIVEVLYGCALRLSECVHLDVDDID